MDRLSFALRFPFSDSSREIIKSLNISTDSLPENAIRRGALLVSKAFSATKPSLPPSQLSRAEQESELAAFPIAKMFVSLMDERAAPQRLALYFQKSTFSFLVDSHNPKDSCIELADDLKVNYSLVDSEMYFAQIPLIDYLDIHFVDEELKLVNAPLEDGKVFLNLNHFARFLSEKAYKKIIDSLPIPSAQIPKPLHAVAKSLQTQLAVSEKKSFDLKLAGKIDPSLFPPCMSAVYVDQLAGKKLPYTHRLAIASFLYQLGMPKPQLLEVFSKSPDYKKEIAEYHIDRIIDKQLSAPGCAKISEQGMRVRECDKACTFKHPVQYYISHLRAKNRLANRASSVRSQSFGGTAN